MGYAADLVRIERTLPSVEKDVLRGSGAGAHDGDSDGRPEGERSSSRHHDAAFHGGTDLPGNEFGARPDVVLGRRPLRLRRIEAVLDQKRVAHQHDDEGRQDQRDEGFYEGEASIRYHTADVYDVTEWAGPRLSTRANSTSTLARTGVSAVTETRRL